MLVVFLLIFLPFASAQTYPCQVVKPNGIAQLISCQLNTPPFPLDWEFDFILKTYYYWNGISQIKAKFYNEKGEVSSNCTMAADLPGGYSHFASVGFKQTCFSFDYEGELPIFAQFIVFATNQSPIVLKLKVPPLKARDNQSTLKNIRSERS